MTSPRWLVQMSDVPWLVVAGALGLVVEAALWFSGGPPGGSPWWVIPARGALAAGGICGWLAFRFARTPPGFLLGASAGVMLAVVPPWFLPPVGIPFPPATVPLALGLGVAWGIIPPLTHTLVLPLLSMPRIRRLASHHPRYAYLRDDAEVASSRRP